MNIAVIPARGGSKRIPHKNIKEFCGKPMIAHAISAAKESCLFDHIVVSTDDEDIAEIARACGAETPFPPSTRYLSDDHTHDCACYCSHAITGLPDLLGWSFQSMCAVSTPVYPFLQA